MSSFAKHCKLSAILLTLVGRSSFAQTVSLLDNTSGGTATLNPSVTSSLGVNKSIQFTVANGYTADLTGFKLGLKKSGTFAAKLWSWDPSTSTATLLESESLTSNAGLTVGYYDFVLSAAGFSGLATGTYLFGFGGNVPTIDWYGYSPAPAMNTSTGITTSGYVYSLNGTTWTSTPSASSIQLNGIVTPTGGGAVPEPGEWAAMGILGAGLAGLVMRKRKRA